MTDKISETQIATAIQDWLISEGWDCYPEAQLRARGPRADILAVKHPCVWVVETKLSMSLMVLEQALRWRSAGATYVSIGVLAPRRKQDQKFLWHSHVVDSLCRREGIGLILVDRDDLNVREVIEPKLYRHNYRQTRYILDGLHQRMKDFNPGSTTLDGYSTPHQRTMEDVFTYLNEHSPCYLDEILKNVKTHYRVRRKARTHLVKHLCNHPDVDYQHEGYDTLITLKKGAA